MLMLAVGLLTTPRALRALGRRWELALRELVVVWIAVPLLALLVTAVFRTPPIATGMLLIMAACPGVPLLVMAVRRHGGDVDTALLVLLATSLSALVMVPVWVAILSRIRHVDFAMPVSGVLAVLLRNVLLPFLAGMIVRAVTSARSARRLARIAMALFAVGTAVLVIALFSKGIPVLREATPRAFVAMIVMTFAAASIGFFAGGPRFEDRTTLAYASALGNPALAIAVVARNAPDAPALALVAGYVIVRTLTLVPFGVWLRHHARAPART